VFFTAPTRLAEHVVSDDLKPHVERMAHDFPTSHAYLGVACAVLALKKPLTPYYVLNIGDETVELTGVIEMTNLVDRDAETMGRSLIYLPRYLGADDERLAAPDAELIDTLVGRGLKRIFPDFSERDIDYAGVHRARYVQPLPLVGSAPADAKRLAGFEQPFQILNTSMLTCATLNNNEVVSLVDGYVKRHASALRER
jgi:protoporphyrinogen oxidase